jgi:hypothetical protein
MINKSSVFFVSRRIVSRKVNISAVRCLSATGSNGDKGSEFSQQNNPFLFAATKSVGWIAAGGATATFLLTSSVSSAGSIFVLAYFASRAAQPFVNTKLAVQRAKKDPPKNIIDFFGSELRMFQAQSKDVGFGPNAHAGGNVYALRGALAKMLTFAGFDAMHSLISPTLTAVGVPTLLIVPTAAFISGFIQGTLVSLPEYLSTLQSRYPDKSNAELWKMMFEKVQDTNGLPILAVSLRNGVFDMVFNTLRVSFGVPFGPSAVASMTINYPIERFRSLVHQHEYRQRQEGDPKFSSANFQGWFSKAVEFFVIYQCLQILMEQRNKQMKKESQ